MRTGREGEGRQVLYYYPRWCAASPWHAGGFDVERRSGAPIWGFALITLKDVQKVAALAHLQLSDEELARMTEELGGILDHIATLSEVRTDHISPTSQVLDLRNVLRDDSVQPSLPVEAVLANAPDREDGWFRVRAVLEEVAE